MGENEQGGMLRTVVVIGIVAMVALIVTLGVVGLKNNMNKSSNNAVVTMQKIPLPVPGTSGNINFKKYDATTTSVAPYQPYYLPDFGALAPKHWETIRVYLTAETDIDLTVDTNLFDRTIPHANIGMLNDDDDVSKRQLIFYDDQGNPYTGTLKAGYSYVIQTTSYNNRSVPLYHRCTSGSGNDWEGSKLTITPSTKVDTAAKVTSIEYAQYGDEIK